MNVGASFEASLREAPQDEEVDPLREPHGAARHSWSSNTSLIPRCSGEARASKDAPAHLQDAWTEPFAMPPPSDRPAFDLPASRWHWRET